MKGKKLYFWLALIVVGSIVTWTLANRQQEARGIQVKKGVISRQIEETAIVQPVSDEKIYSGQNARVAALPVEIGQVVAQGQILLELKNTELDIQLAETKSRLSQAQSSVMSTRTKIIQLDRELKAAETNFTRLEVLYQQGAISQSEYDKAKLTADKASSDLEQQNSLLGSEESEVNGLTAQFKELESQSSELEVVSPIDGQVLELPVKKDQPVSRGDLLAAVGSSRHLELKADILSDDLADIRIGQRVTISAPVLGNRQTTGQVAKIYPRAEEKMSALGVIQRRVPVIINLNNQLNLQPGYEVRIGIEINRLENVLILPIESVQNLSAQQKQVLLVKDGRVIIRKVKTGISDQNHIQITEGLSAGDVIIRDANLNLKPHARVKLLP